MSDDDGLEARLEEHINRARRKIEAAELGNGGNEILRLAKLSTIEYDQERQAKADKLGIRVSALDSAVNAERKKFAQERTDFLPHWNVEPWPEAINGSALLEELRQHFKRYVVLPKHADVALALWVLHTWVFDGFDITPYLAITSPTRRCGKTVLMTMLYWLCRRAKKNDHMSKASIYRSVEAEQPTLILDEVGWVVDMKDERQGILCGGFERLGFVEICEGEGAEITH
jgi:putative DNA primase/helicase